jgi:HAD superfamily hydrolase (TIGR01662 family)
VTRAVFFDVDFTLIFPGPRFQGAGYRDFCAAYGIRVDADGFAAAVAASSPLLDVADNVYDPDVFIRYTRSIIEHMGGAGDALDAVARRIFDEWAYCHHFELYNDVPDVLRSLHETGMTIGLISNTGRCLTSFQRHFALEGLFSVAVSSSDHGYMKPHPSIFEEALRQAGVAAQDAVMVGDSLPHDIAGARALGMRAVLVSRGRLTANTPDDVPVIRTLRELPALL